MITLKYPSLPADGQIQWERAECLFVPGQKLLDYINLPEELIEQVVFEGDIIQPYEIAYWVPRDGDEYHVLPRMSGKNKALIVGILGAIAAVALIPETGGTSWALFMSYAQAATLGFGVATALATLTSHPPRTKTDNSKSIPGFAGDANGEVAGIAQPVVLGDEPKVTSGVRVSSFVRVGTYLDISDLRSLSGTGSSIKTETEVTGVGTKFTTEVTMGDAIRLGGVLIGVVDAINSDTSLSLVTAATITRTNQPISDTRVGGSTSYREGEKSYQLLNMSKAPWGIQEIRDVQVNDQPIANFPGATYAYTLGETPEQWYNAAGAPIARPEAFDVTANTFAQTTELTGTPTIYTTSSGINVDAIEVIFGFPSGLLHTDSKGDQNNVTRYKVRYRLFGATPWTNFPVNDSHGTPTGFDSSGVFEKAASQRSNFFTYARLDHLTPGRYDVEVSWVGSDHIDATKDAWKVFLAGVTEEQSNAQPNPGYAMLAVSALAIESLNGSTPQVSCGGKWIKVPWHNGTSWQAPTWYGPDGPTAFAPIGRNPAWLTLELHRDGGADRTYPAGYVRWGLGLPDSKIDIPMWRSVAAKCDVSTHVVLDTGAEYDEPLHQLDGVLSTQRSAVEVRREIMAAFRAAPMMGGRGDQHSVFYDGEADLSQIVTVGNMASGTFAPVYDCSRKTNTFDVTYNDRDRSGDTTTRTVVNSHLVTTRGKAPKPEAIAMDWTSRWTEVLRNSQFALRKHEFIRTSCTYEMRTDAILWRAGDVVGVQHDLPEWGFGGRVRNGANTTTHVITPLKARSASGSIFLIDNDGSERLFDPAHKTYEVRVRLQDGSAEEGQLRTVSAGSVTTDGYFAVDVTAAFSSAPQYNDPVSFGELGKSVKPFRCIAITRSANSFRKVTCVEYNGTIYPPSGVVTTIDYSALPNFSAAPGPIMQCVAHEDLSQGNDRANTSTVIVDWSRPVSDPSTGFYRGADLERSFDGRNFTLIDHVPGTQYHWPGAPQEVQLWFRATPYSTSDRRNLAGRCVSVPIICHGSQAVPANVSGLVATVEGDSYVWRWTDISREMQYEGRDVDSGWGTADSRRLFIGRVTEFKINGPTVRSKTIYVRAFQPTAAAGTSTPIYSAASASATASKAAPAAPTIGARVTSTQTIKIPVGAASDTGVTGIRLWASQTTGFTPSTATQVAQIVPPAGGDFIFHLPAAGTWFFKVAAADPLTDRIGDYTYSSQFSSAIIVIVPQNPGTPTFTQNPTTQRRRAVVTPSSGPPVPTHVFSLFLNWTFADSINPAGSHVGFYVQIYPSGGDPELPYLSHTIMDTASRFWGIDGITFEASATWVGAVKALYADGSHSSLITSTGLALDPATGDDVLAQLKLDSHGGYYSNDTQRITAPDGSIITIDKNGVWTTNSDGIQRTPRRASHAVLHGATGGQFVSWTDPRLDPPLMPNVFGVPTSKLHVVTQMRNGTTLAAAPLYYPTRFQCDAGEISNTGFRLALAQYDGGVDGLIRATADNSGNWTVNGSADGAATARHGALLTMDASQPPTNTLGHAGWYDPIGSGLGGDFLMRAIMTFAADMPAVFKSDGTPYYVDLSFGVMRSGGANLTWNGTCASLASGPTYNLWGVGPLRAYTNGKRWRLPWVAISQLAFTDAFVMWWTGATYETGTSSGSSAPTRVLVDAFEQHGIFNPPTTPMSFRGSFADNGVDVLVIEDF